MSTRHAHDLVFIVAALIAAFEAHGQSAVPGTRPATEQVVHAAPAPAGDRVVILAVTVNGLAGDPGAIFLQDDTGKLFASASFLKTWNLRPGESRMTSADGTVYFALDGIDGMTYAWDHARAELAISAAAEDFLPTRINVGSERVQEVAPYTPGGYLNYDLTTTHSPGVSTHAAFVDVALFRGVDLLTSSFLGSSAGSARLMTTWQTDRLDAIKTLRLGDSYNTTGAWGRGMLFGGIQYGTNFAIRPDFVPFATPSVSGKALLPSTVDVYVDNALRSRQQVNAGPFSIQNLPVITGAGDMQVVVKDVLGREQVITQPFFASPTLLRQGLVDESYEFGWQRHNYGLTSNDYSDPFAAATYRRGLSNHVTGEARIELQKAIKTAGASIAAKLPGIGSVVEFSAAFSDAHGLSTGAMASARYSYLGQRWSASARLQLNSPDFRQLGSDPASLPKQIGAAQVSAPLGDGTLSLNYLRRLNQGESMTRIVNLSYSRRLSEHMFASFILLKPLSTSGATVASLTLTFLFDDRHVGSAAATGQPGGGALYAEFQQSTPRDTGTGYRVAAMQGGSNSRQEASVTRNQSFGTFQAEVVRLNQEVSSRLTARGSIASLGDGVFFARGLDQGFAVVKVGDVSGIPVSLENQVVARTDVRGRALVTNVQAYQKNHIGIDPVSLPLEASIGEVERTVVPRTRGGVLVDFKIRTVRSATLTIIQADGTPLPPWTAVEVVGMKGGYVSGNRGEVFVDLPNPRGNRVIARPTQGPVCELHVDQPPVGSIAPFLGPLTCAQGR